MVMIEVVHRKEHSTYTLNLTHVFDEVVHKGILRSYKIMSFQESVVVLEGQAGVLWVTSHKHDLNGRKQKHKYYKEIKKLDESAWTLLITV